jgi:hypothetical protein
MVSCWVYFWIFIVLALEVPSLFYSIFNFFITLFYLAIDFYKSETGKTIVDCIKQLVINYLDYCSRRELIRKNGKR